MKFQPIFCIIAQIMVLASILVGCPSILASFNPGSHSGNPGMTQSYPSPQKSTQDTPRYAAEQQRLIIETAARLEGFQQAEKDGFITASQKDQIRASELKRLEAGGIKIEPDSIGQIAKSMNIEMAPQPTTLSKIAGWFTFTHIIATIVSFIFIGSLLYLFGDLIVNLLSLFILIPKELYEALVYGTSIFALLFANRASTNHTNVEIIALLGALGFAGSILFSKWLRSWKGGHETEFFSLLTVVFSIGAVLNESSVVAFLSSITLVAALGFVAEAVPFGYAIGFKDEEALGRVTSAGIILVVFFVALTLSGTFVQPKIELFKFGILWVGTFVSGLGLLIASSKHYGRDRYILFNFLAIIFGIAALLFGSVYSIGTIQKIGGTFFVLYVIDKFIDMPLTTFRQWALATCLTSGGIIAFVIYCNDHFEKIRPYLFF